MKFTVLADRRRQYRVAHPLISLAGERGAHNRLLHRARRPWRCTPNSRSPCLQGCNGNARRLSDYPARHSSHCTGAFLSATGRAFPPGSVNLYSMTSAAIEPRARASTCVGRGSPKSQSTLECYRPGTAGCHTPEPSNGVEDAIPIDAHLECAEHINGDGLR